jgi:hypothetical protein
LKVLRWSRPRRATVDGNGLQNGHRPVPKQDRATAVMVLRWIGGCPYAMEMPWQSHALGPQERFIAEKPFGPPVAWNRQCFGSRHPTLVNDREEQNAKYRCVRSAQRRAAPHSREGPIGTHELCLRVFGRSNTIQYFRYRDCDQEFVFSYGETQLGRRK